MSSRSPPIDVVTQIMHVRSGKIKDMPAMYHAKVSDVGSILWLWDNWIEGSTKVCNNRGDSKVLAEDFFKEECMVPYMASKNQTYTRRTKNTKQI